MSETAPIIVKKKKVQPAAHHGGSWKVAYADFVTAMMAFFMVMWIMGMSAETRSMVAGYFNDPMGFMKNPPKSVSPFSTPGSPTPKPGTGKGTSDSRAVQDELKLKEVESEFKKAMESEADLKELTKHVVIEMTEEGLRIELVEAAGAVFFETGKDVIRPIALKLIAKISPILAKSKRHVVVEGHTDSAQYAGMAYNNWDLSVDRARSLRRALSFNGVPQKQFTGVFGYADTKLRNPSDPLHFSNRRVTLLLPFGKSAAVIESLPKENLEQAIQGVFRRDIGIAPPVSSGQGRATNQAELNAFGVKPGKER
jgi:chemotaxis protein MotB